MQIPFFIMLAYGSKGLKKFPYETWQPWAASKMLENQTYERVEKNW